MDQRTFDLVQVLIQSATLILVALIHRNWHDSDLLNGRHVDARRETEEPDHSNDHD